MSVEERKDLSQKPVVPRTNLELGSGNRWIVEEWPVDPKFFCLRVERDDGYKMNVVPRTKRGSESKEDEVEVRFRQGDEDIGDVTIINSRICPGIKTRERAWWETFASSCVEKFHSLEISGRVTEYKLYEMTFPKIVQAEEDYLEGVERGG